PNKEYPNINILFKYLINNLDIALVLLRYLLKLLYSKKNLILLFIIIPNKKITILYLTYQLENLLIVNYILKKFNTPYHLDFINNRGFIVLYFMVFYGYANIIRKLYKKKIQVDILIGDKFVSPEGRRNTLDYYYYLLNLDISNLQDSYSIVRDI
ncbi:hypothetical protein BGZ61DRAFT_373816, partial [Ilyonectria robusta]|uniref:uncharacterized protein n=1 Tax=Ilyonectria robusta TaxID=1079257 RepID=UPI001E8D7A51